MSMGDLWGSGLISSLFDKGMNDMSAQDEETIAEDKVGSGDIGVFVKNVTMQHLKDQDASQTTRKKKAKNK